MGNMKAVQTEIEEQYPDKAEELPKEFHKFLHGEIEKMDISPELYSVLKASPGCKALLA